MQKKKGKRTKGKRNQGKKEKEGIDESKERASEGMRKGEGKGKINVYRYIGKLFI